MDPSAPASHELGSFDPVLATAVVAVLRSERLRVWAEQGRVLVVPADREAALAALAARMDQVNALAAELRDQPPEDAQEAGWREPPGWEGRPLVMERFRRAGAGVALLLVPLLGVTLAQTLLPRQVIVAVLVVGAGAVLLARRRQR